ncbi:MAG: T9SS type A sorting domain-containing protein [Bacteroidales bacterium]|nr:T9SS type A sorting domain-containing protein [Bacteroidales bacterium]
MKKTLLQLLAIAFLVLTANMAVAQTYTFPVRGTQGFTLTQSTRNGARVNYELGQFSLSQINYRGEEMSEISINAICIPNDAGLPNLPVESRLIAIPQGAKAQINVVRAEKQTFQNVNIAPALRLQAEDEEPEMNYEKDMKVYAKNAFYPENPFSVNESYIRGVDAINVSITPFQYNPVTKELVVYTDIELSVEYSGGNGHIGDDRLRSPYWDPILAAELMNYDQLPVIDYEARMQDWIRNNRDGAEYLIIIPNNDAWEPYAQQLKEFRTKQGIITEVYRLDEIPATTTSQLKTWFHNAYSTWQIAPVAVCLFGDHNTNMALGIPAETTSHPYSGSCITDNFYADAVGNDNLPDMVFTRLVAQNETELPIFVSKQIEYETAPNTDASFYNAPITALGWQTERWFQLCSEVFGGYMRNHGYNPQRINCLYQGSTPGSVWSSAQNTATVVNYFGPNGQNYIPSNPQDMGGWTGGTPDQVVQAVNNGTFWVQHRDHGLDEGWGEPAVRNHHIDQLNNVGKLPFVMSINCQTGMFNYTGSNGNCFTEKWLRRTFNGQNAGAVGVLSPTEVSYSFVNDAFVWGVYDLFDGDFLPTYGPFAANTGNWMPAFGNVAGKYFLAQSSWPYNADSKDITYTMFTAHCDAFLRIYTQVPQTMAVNHQSVQLAGLVQFQITAPEGTTIALTKGEGANLEIVAVATGTGSVQTIDIAPQVPPTVLHLTVTGQNYLRYEADIDVIPADGPYIIVNEYELSDEATQLNFGENAGFNIQLKNVGNSTAPAGSMTLTSESEYVSITNGTAEFTTINSNNTLDLSEAFAFTISDEVPNNTPIEFLITISSGDDTYESYITMKAYAPVFQIGDVTITELEGDGNGRLDPGERVRLRFPVMNKGNAASRETNIELVMNNVFMQIISDPVITTNSIGANGTMAVEYEVYVGGAPSGFAAEYTLNVVSGVYTASKDFMSKIGLNVEDFEAGEFNTTLWTNDLPYPWTFVTDDPYEGQYCVKSGHIGDNQETVLTLNFEVGEPDSIAFYYKVSSESGYDKMHFFIDGQEQGTWSGTVAWTIAQYAVNPGTHTFVWKYTKDTSVASGGDCCWIDFVILPRDVSLSVNAGLDMTTCVDMPAQINGYAANQTSLEWTTAGDGTFDDVTSPTPVYTPGTQDIDNGSVVLTITAHKDSETLSDDMTLSFESPLYINNALIDYYYCADNSPKEIAVEISGDYTTFTWVTEGDGTFENASALETSYTPGPQDLANGYAPIIALAENEACGPTSYDYTISFEPLPQMTLAAESIEICQTEEAVMNFTLSGGIIYIPSEPVFVININGVNYDEFYSGANSLNLGTMEPGENIINIRSIRNQLCHVTFEEGEFTFTVNVIPGEAAPEIEGVAELDVYLVSSTSYNVTSDVMVDFTLEPEDAGTLVPANDGKSVEIRWSESYKGNAVLTAIPVDGCYIDNGTMNIVVKNSYDVNEIANNTKIYPNPTSGKINIEVAGMTHVTVVNAIGQFVYDTDVDADQVNVDMTPFPAGTYLVRIVTDKGVCTKHINLIK